MKEEKSETDQVSVLARPHTSSMPICVIQTFGQDGLCYLCEGLRQSALEQLCKKALHSLGYYPRTFNEEVLDFCVLKCMNVKYI